MAGAVHYRNRLAGFAKKRDGLLHLAFQEIHIFTRPPARPSWAGPYFRTFTARCHAETALTFAPTGTFAGQAQHILHIEQAFGLFGQPYRGPHGAARERHAAGRLMGDFHPFAVGGEQHRVLADDVTGAFTTQFGLTKGTGGLKEDEQTHTLPSMPRLDGRNRDGTRYTWAFPAMTFAAGTEAMWVYEARPLGPARCYVTMSVCFPQETIDSDGFDTKAAYYYERMDDALEEDRGVLESQQEGVTALEHMLDARAVYKGKLAAYAPKLDIALNDYQQHFDDQTSARMI